MAEAGGGEGRTARVWKRFRRAEKVPVCPGKAAAPRPNGSCGRGAAISSPPEALGRSQSSPPRSVRSSPVSRDLSKSMRAPDFSAASDADFLADY